ncbi:MAG: hypothetical protein HC927_12960 [Deltaproteobacteria bacterium]|nr:hypothetical protein [Deltaproteobacteria bacterium]
MNGPLGEPPEGLGAVLRRGLAWRAAARFDSVDELLDALLVRSRERSRALTMLGRQRRPLRVVVGLAATFLIALGVAPEGPATRSVEAELGALAPAEFLLIMSEQHLRTGDHDGAIDSLEAARKYIDSGDGPRRYAEAAMRLGTELELRGERALAAKAYAIAWEVFEEQGMQTLAITAAERARAAMEPL